MSNRLRQAAVKGLEAANDHIQFLDEDEYDDEDDDFLGDVVVVQEDMLRQQRHLQRASFYKQPAKSFLEKSTRITDPIPIVIISNYGFKIKSELYFEVIISNTMIKDIYWRAHPDHLGCNFKFVTKVEKRIGKRGFYIVFIDWDLHILLDDASTERDIMEMLNKQLSMAKAAEMIAARTADSSSPYADRSMTPNKSFSLKTTAPDFSKYFSDNVLKAEYSSATRQEQLLQLTQYFRYKEAFIILEKHATRTRFRLLLTGLAQWVEQVRIDNDKKMQHDKKRWRIHTAANQENDLQAWYHSVFSNEVYRLRGPFWYRDAVLPVYRKSYAIVDTGMTSLEEAAVSHVLCSPDTTYGDVAGHMFVVQAIVNDVEYKLFQQLVSHGIQSIKYPRMGRPAKKHFRISFVEGSVYFTWKGKFGNQGINLGEVNGLVEGLSTDVLRRSGTSSKHDNYTSLVCNARSVDICLDTPEEKALWKALLEKLVAKEHGILNDISLEYPDQPGSVRNDDNDLAWLVLYNAIGEAVITPAIRAHLLKLILS